MSGIDPGLLHVALQMAAMGVAVWPMDPRTSRPYTSGGEHDASTDPERIRAWWGEREDLVPVAADKANGAAHSLNGLNGAAEHATPAPPATRPPARSSTPVAPAPKIVTAEQIAQALNAKRSGDGWVACCVAHEDTNPSMSISEGRDGRVLVHCFVGCTQAELVDALKARGLWSESPAKPGITVADLARAKGLPESLLRESGFADELYFGRSAIRMTYLGMDKKPICTRYRIIDAKGQRDFRFKKGNRQQLFGLWRLKSDEDVILVEGETDAMALWDAGFNAIGVPGAQAWQDQRFAAYLENCPAIFVHVENDAGGPKFRESFEKSRLRNKVRFFTVDPQAKDPCELRQANTEGFREAIESRLREARGIVVEGPWRAAAGGNGAARTQDTKEAAEDAPGPTLEDFYAYMPDHSYIFTPTRELWPAASVNSRLKDEVRQRTHGTDDADMKAGMWLDKNRPVEQMTWAPGHPSIIKDKLVVQGGWIDKPGTSAFNLYLPPTPLTGDPMKAAHWLGHVERVYPQDHQHIIKWLAHRVQRPHEKINHALVLGGNQGIGKDSILEPVTHGVGPWNFAEVSPAQLMGRFNGFIKSVILRVSEARDSGELDRFAFYEHTKTLAAAPPPTLLCDEKNLKEHQVFNVVGLIITTNHKTNGIYLPADDRRHYVAWSELTKDDFDDAYWTALYRWYHEEGGIGHVVEYLRTIDLRKFNPKAPPPKTNAFLDIVDSNRAPEDAELADTLELLSNPPAVTVIDLISYATESFQAWLTERKNRRQIPHRMETSGYVPVRNPNAADGLWKISGKRQVIYGLKEKSSQDQLRAVAAYIEKSGGAVRH